MGNVQNCDSCSELAVPFLGQAIYVVCRSWCLTPEGSFKAQFFHTDEIDFTCLCSHK
jgi:hypothetical protein